MNAIASYPPAVFLRPPVRPTPPAPERSSSPASEDYALVARSLAVGAGVGALLGSAAGLALGFHPALMAAAGLITGAWVGVAVGYGLSFR